MIEKSLLKLFLQDKELYEKYHRFVNLEFIKTNYIVLYKLYLILNSFYLNNNNINEGSTTLLESQYLASYPMLKDGDRKELSIVLEDLDKLEVNRESLLNLLESHKNRSLANNIALVALDVAEGRRSVEELSELAGQLENKLSVETETDEFEILTTDIEILAQQETLEPGLHWRLTGLNKSLGPLRKGNFGHIFARIESGKTGLWVSESMHMIKQIPEDGTLDIFFNEENGKDIIWRMYSSVLRWDAQQIMSNPKKAKDLFYAAIGGEKIRFFDRATLDRKFIEKAVEKGNPKLVIIDNMDKVKGFENERKDLQLANCYKWGRELAKSYCPVISVGQADATASNQMWVSESQMADGKTGKPSETDFAIGIGRTDSSQHPYERFLFISRNKLRGDENTIENLRHAKFSAILLPQYSVFEDGGTHAIL